ncbi:hypothetical protein VTI28DRAFT_9831 [Corynascus sepedonium]
MAAANTPITISCHCGAARQTVAPRGSQGVFSDTSFCHCTTCRRTTGLLCTSYAPVAAPSTVGLEGYAISPTTTAYFCSTCGCHIFRVRRLAQSATAENWEWEVATGTIIDAPEEEDERKSSNLPSQWRHQHVQDTQDGGLAIWLPGASTPASLPPNTATPALSLSAKDDDDDDANDTLLASCHCASIRLRITRPAVPPESPLNPDSGYPDLLLPYVSTPASTVANPAHERWYLRRRKQDVNNNYKYKHIYSYLAGTCACQTCRLASGFEIQTWAFIPRRNIFLVSQPSSPGTSSSSSKDEKKGEKEPTATPLDFTTLPRDTLLRQYESSPGRIRDFCGRCGATVFWHDTFRPDLIDVSVGLLSSAADRGKNGDGGARAQGWLEWWTGRVSFFEEAGKGRTGAAKAWGESVIRALEEGMDRAHRASGQHWEAKGVDA